MAKLRRLFFDIDFTWKKVVIFSIATAVFTAVLNLIPALHDTSFTDPAANMDIWVLFALIIIMNCESYREAVLKTFIFFVISQPLIYLIEVPFIDDGWSVFRYYPYWGMITLATIPGAALAYRVKVQDRISAVILSLATGLLLIMVVMYSRMDNVHVISIVFCITLAGVLIWTLLSERKERVIAIVLSLIFAAAYLVSVVNQAPPCSIYMLDDAHQWEVASETDERLDVEIEDGFRLLVTPYTDGEYIITVKDESGSEEELQVSVKNDGQDTDIEEVE